MDAAPHPPETARITVLGHHRLLEFCGCDPAILDDAPHLERLLAEACREAGATVLQSLLHRFSPQGVSGIVVISESHVAVHTWPEHAYAAIDLFTCGDPGVATRIEEHLHRSLQPGSSSDLTIDRGFPQARIRPPTPDAPQ